MHTRTPTFSSFADFWPFYLEQHQNSRCRVLHFLGTALSVLSLGFYCVTGYRGLIVVTLLLGYGFAWWGHFAFEKNRPATFRFPIYSLLGDLKMFRMMLRGNLNQELKRLGLPQD